MGPRIIYENKKFLAIDKPAGLLVHGQGREGVSKEPTLVGWLLKKYPEIKEVGDPSTRSGQANLRPGIVHRLDKGTSGVILVARNQRYFEYLKNLFKTGKIKKTYTALVWGKLEPKQGIIKKPIRIKTGSVKRTVWRGKAEKEAITEYRVLEYSHKIYKNKSITNSHDRKDLLYFSLVEVSPKTGRTHQIRIHLASIGHSVVGDSLYGKKENPFNLKRQFLHAQSLEFNIEEGRRIRIETELPEELKRVIDDLRTKK